MRVELRGELCYCRFVSTICLCPSSLVCCFHLTPCLLPFAFSFLSPCPVVSRATASRPIARAAGAAGALCLVRPISFLSLVCCTAFSLFCCSSYPVLSCSRYFWLCWDGHVS